MIIKYNKKDFNDLINNEVLLFFHTDTCAGCKLMEKSINSISDYIPVIVIDAEKERMLCKKYGVMSVPTLVYFKNSVYDKKSGYMSFDEIIEWLDLGDEIDEKTN